MTAQTATTKKQPAYPKTTMLRRLSLRRLERLDHLLHFLHVPRRWRKPVCDEYVERLSEGSPWIHIGGRWVSSAQWQWSSNASTDTLMGRRR